MGPVDVCNLALAEVGQRIRIGNFQDNSPAAQVASLFYTPKVQSLLRAAHWGFARAQATLTQWEARIINGAVNTLNPPPQPWLYSYLYPTDCQKLRFLQPLFPTQATNPPLTTNATPSVSFPSMPTDIPFVEATDFDTRGNNIRVVLTNLTQAQAIYTRDLSQTPDLWDSLFHSAVTAYLGSYFINALSRDKQQMAEQVTIAKNILDQARMINANEGIGNIDHRPDWIRTRKMSNFPWALSLLAGPGGFMTGGWDSLTFPNGEFY